MARGMTTDAVFADVAVAWPLPLPEPLEWPCPFPLVAARRNDGSAAEMPLVAAATVATAVARADGSPPGRETGGADEPGDEPPVGGISSVVCSASNSGA